ncbi:hypothetical protein CS797_03950 [Campylobacter jejuni]|uniref:hypothetical protein n=1 Tax=Campylobacter TaxID=194 RepID=UPI001068A091|nr:MULTISPECIES: hypothetical protein [Campylobacter]EAJ1453205.1 hypothetical protein [Campylobacter jejuni]EDO8215274.1 hypothetical protein [Campylobacter jejuni]MBX1794738.1 hypothetical protein [Campylobacter jejuni]MCW1870313.1 hypothetical protein [Campylobacter jejuni]TEX85172.1 hypothetical protein ELQ09_04690 [Campylobacter sp. CH186]
MKCFNAKFMFVGILAVFLSACSSGIPKCSDQDVQNVLTEIDRKKLKFTYSGFMSDLTDKESKTQYCKAQVKANGSIDSRPYKWDAWIEYFARYTDDGMVYVEITR